MSPGGKHMAYIVCSELEPPGHVCQFSNLPCCRIMTEHPRPYSNTIDNHFFLSTHTKCTLIVEKKGGIIVFVRIFGCNASRNPNFKGEYVQCPAEEGKDSNFYDILTVSLTYAMTFLSLIVMRTPPRFSVLWSLQTYK